MVAYQRDARLLHLAWLEKIWPKIQWSIFLIGVFAIFVSLFSFTPEAVVDITNLVPTGYKRVDRLPMGLMQRSVNQGTFAEQKQNFQQIYLQLDVYDGKTVLRQTLVSNNRLLTFASVISAPLLGYLPGDIQLMDNGQLVQFSERSTPLILLLGIFASVGWFLIWGVVWSKITDWAGLRPNRPWRPLEI